MTTRVEGGHDSLLHARRHLVRRCPRIAHQKGWDPLGLPTADAQRDHDHSKNQVRKLNIRIIRHWRPVIRQINMISNFGLQQRLHDILDRRTSGLLSNGIQCIFSDVICIAMDYEEVECTWMHCEEDACTKVYNSASWSHSDVTASCDWTIRCIGRYELKLLDNRGWNRWYTRWYVFWIKF